MSFKAKNKKQIKKMIMLLTITITVLMVVVVWLIYQTGKVESQIQEKTKENKNIDVKYAIRPSGNIAQEKNGVGNKGWKEEVSEFTIDLDKHIATLDGCYGIYCIDIEGSIGFGVNENKEFYAASTVKVPLALYVCKLMEEGIVQPDRELEYTKADYESGSGNIQFKDFGSVYTVRDLLGMSIRFSDNVAANMLIRMTDYSNIKNFMRNMGGSVVDDKQNISCPKDMAIYLLNVYNFSQESRYGQELISHLENTVFNERIPALLPKDTKVAHKIGNWIDSYHDVGIVFAKNPYVVSIMSKGVTEEDAFKEIANISGMVFNFFSKKNRTDNPSE